MQTVDLSFLAFQIVAIAVKWQFGAMFVFDAESDFSRNQYNTEDAAPLIVFGGVADVVFSARGVLLVRCRP